MVAMASDASLAVMVSITCSISVFVSKVCMIYDLALASSMLNVASSSVLVGATADPSMCFHSPCVFRASVMRNFQCRWLLDGPLSLGIDPMNVEVGAWVWDVLGWEVTAALESGMLGFFFSVGEFFWLCGLF